MSRLRHYNRLISHRRRRRGASVTELALVLPLLLLQAFGIMEFGGIFFVKNNMQQAARHAARLYALGEITAAEAEQIARDQLAELIADEADIDVSSSAPESRDRWIEITAPIREAAIGDPLKMFDANRELTVRVTMRNES